MHLLFLGIFKSIMLDVQEWMKARKKFTSFLRFIKDVPESVQTLALDWCAANDYGKGKFGNKVSENYLADAKLALWVYSTLDLLTSEPPFKQPTTPQHTWLKRSNIGWLRAHNLSTDGNASEVSKRVEEFMNQEGGPPA